MNEAAEADIYASYAFDFGLSLGFTDYYYPGTQYFDISKGSGAHGFELNIGYNIGNFNMSANYIMNEAGGAGTAGGDKYFEVSYTLAAVSFFAGAGDGWHTVDGHFAFCNAGVSAGKDIRLSEKYSLPLTGYVILNPDKEQFYVVIGISF